MKRLKNNDCVVVYHEADDEGNHYYRFLDGGKRVYLEDWGEIGLVPGWNDRFPHPKRNIELRLEGVVSSASDP
ncbi:MAG: hypothetical protein COZ37_07135 [bacterium (Candidatus Ratteibacteria) CG_4_10_14_3_um_filter_41_18]|uniref:Uncharacterized protein n=4 Tax=Candidatus Ratteibacteria TaxID=2979319 RepID=A0A2M7EAK9_9BACT|nr:MAG: hypothetical protein COS11_00380 [bacterium (Candidatus Ratteibacteria) CG01_land_8_20_14_3_00_40_19]PIW33871.1 MAG: hypothetical protein COW28_02260 [bacterium (Candidatus Ratteibacteria) CG15_BIG_FIL_POST_REV_8_21_14_020_41_12]PIX76577.1 MAG: hypothetical protein COZ37_07135 [bacterium (Candidatus Ratteibacteria) CG_4_10_14_3_um_filter_41_18]PJA61992.1 MAG: hypothetical protein CO162_03415 [bacterium (Candidatus Ratteibacteria) CG_4_9_14_3_um_filter_41_21]HCG76653.1 hypothetical prote